MSHGKWTAPLSDNKSKWFTTLVETVPFLDRCPYAKIRVTRPMMTNPTLVTFYH